MAPNGVATRTPPADKSAAKGRLRTNKLSRVSVIAHIMRLQHGFANDVNGRTLS
jgi:hypothetical protein